MLRILPPSCLIKANCFSLCFYMGSNLIHFIILFKGFRKLLDVTAPRLPGWQFLFFDGSSPKRMLNLASVQVRKSLLIGRHDRISVGKMDLLSDQTLRRAPLSFQLLAARLNNCIHLKNRPWVLLKGSDCWRIMGRRTSKRRPGRCLALPAVCCSRRINSVCAVSEQSYLWYVCARVSVSVYTGMCFTKLTTYWML